jgi:acyl dehydratase
MTVDQRYFEDVEIGDEFEEEQTPTSEHVQTYLSLAATRGGGRGPRGPGDGRFESVEGARSVGLEAPILPGSMSFSMMSRLVTDWAGVEGRVRNLEVSFRRPVHHNDRLVLRALVTDTTDDDGLRIKLDLYMENERGERPVQGTAEVELPRRPA